MRSTRGSRCADVSVLERLGRRGEEARERVRRNDARPGHASIATGATPPPGQVQRDAVRIEQQDMHAGAPHRGA